MVRQRTKTKKVLKEIEKAGFSPVDVKHLDGYFVFEHGKDMVAHFHIKELKGWRFGIWWDIDGKDKFTFFGQYEKNIDKFKPSRSVFVNEDIAILNLDIKFSVVRILEFIKKHPYRAWAYDNMGYVCGCWDYIPGLQAWGEYLAYKWQYEIREPMLYKRMQKKYLRLISQIVGLYLKDPEIKDMNHGDWEVTPRYSVFCKGKLGEKLEHGHYGLENKELGGKLQKRVDQYNRKVNKFIRKGYFKINDFWYGDYLPFVVRREK